jgi:hypothetical protein
LIGRDFDIDDESFEHRRFESVQSLHHGFIGYQPVRTRIGLAKKVVSASESRTQARTGKNNIELQMNN